jgi:hypothetical protein
VVSFCEHGNDPSVSIKKAGYFFDKLCDSFSNNVLHHGVSYVPKSMQEIIFNLSLLLGIFLFTTASRTARGPTQPPIQGVLGVLSLGVKRSGREADHSPPSSAKIKE